MPERVFERQIGSKRLKPLHLRVSKYVNIADHEYLFNHNHHRSSG